MVIDLNEYSSDGAPVACEVCVVGAGAAGMAIARELAGTGIRVVLLEGGGPDLEAQSQNLYECDIAALPFVGHMAGRYRVFGGSTTRWGGQALPFSPIDFERREWVSHSGWPIGPQDLAGYYPRATAFMRLDALNYDTDVVLAVGAKPPAMDPTVCAFHFSKWAPEPNLRRVYGPLLRAAANITTILHANVVRIDLDEGGEAVAALHVRSLGGRLAVIRPQAVVMCVGGIETARLLLANRHQQPGGIGNAHGLVGRYFHDHPAARVGTLTSVSHRRVQQTFNLFHRRGLKYATRLSMAPAFQRRHRLLSASASVMFLADENSPYAALGEAYRMIRRRSLTPTLARQLLRCAAAIPQLVPTVYQRFARGRTYTPAPTMAVHIISEQEPSPESRITLGTATDALGMPRAVIHWEPTSLTGVTIRRYAHALREQFALAGYGTLELEDWVDSEQADWSAAVRDQAHHMGTARMADSPHEGVVDRRCRVHGIRNLSIGGSAVFPTGGHSNPTLTLLALAIRIADDLKSQFGV